MTDKERIEELERAVVAVMADRGVGHLSEDTQRAVAAVIDPITARKYLAHLAP